MPFRACTVTLLDVRGSRHRIKVDAESLYEAGALALKQFPLARNVSIRRDDILEVAVHGRPMRVQLKVSDVLGWLYERPARSPQQQARKDRLRHLLADERR